MKKIKAQELKTLLQKNPKLKIINVLPEEDFEEEHIPHSLNIPVESEDFVEQVTRQLSNKDETCVIYCASNDCPASTEACKKLEKAGFKNVLDFKGGMEEWKAAGNQVKASV
jgi:rhodanese-related sulfurtransferase